MVDDLETQGSPNTGLSRFYRTLRDRQVRHIIADLENLLETWDSDFYETHKNRLSEMITYLKEDILG